jgi:(2Fe-2S) ferredoxin
MTRKVLVCQYINCLMHGSAEVLAAFSAIAVPPVESQIEPQIEIVASDCQGQCNLGPTVRVLPDEIWYCRVQPTDVPDIATQHLQQGKVVDRLLHPRFHPSFG